jgi:hypothetical protein
MSRVGFEPTIPVLKPSKTVHVLGRVATVIGGDIYSRFKLKYIFQKMGYLVGISTGYGPMARIRFSGGAGGFLFTTASRLALGFTQLLTQWVL